MLDSAFLNNPYPSYHALHAEGPLHWSKEFCGGAWLVTAYADVASVLRDPNFSVQRAGGWVNSSGPEALVELREFKRIFARAMLFLDGSRHARLRKVMNPGFRPAVLQRMAPRIQVIVDKLLDRIESHAEVDFMADFARPLPALVMAEMLGIDSNDRADFVAWSDDIADFIGSPTPNLEIARRAQVSLVALNDYFRALLPQRRQHPGDDFISLLIRAEEAGSIITSKELLAQCSMMLFAGHETTRNLLGNGLLALLQHPEQWQMLKRTPMLMQSALRELLRFDSPVQYTGRRLKANVVLHGKELKKGELVIPLIGAANRDPNQFSNPDNLDITRNEGNHLSFGYGAHVCIGATLTYLEAEIAFNSLIKRLPYLQLVNVNPTWSTNAVYRGLTALPVRPMSSLVTPKRAVANQKR
ncbi:MAG: cytochrome P450 [Pseudomonadota bacterium]